MAKVITQADELSLHNAVREVGARVGRGEHPSAAVEKVAADRGLLPGQVRLVCSAFNTGRQVAQMRANETALEKFATFDLADPDTVLRGLYPRVEVPATRKVAAVVATTEKAACAEAVSVPAKPEESRYARVRRVSAAARSTKRAYEDAFAVHERAAHAVLATTGTLVHAFRKGAADRDAFPRLARAVETYHGGEGRALVSLVETRAGVKRAADDVPVFGRLDPGWPLYKLACECLAAARACNKAAAELEQSRRAYEAAELEYRSLPKEAGLFGSALVGGAAGGASKGLVDQIMGGQYKSPDDLVGSRVSKLDDPRHNAELQRIRAQSLLTSMLADRSEPISGYAPSEVVQAYNEVSQLAPRVATLPGAVRPLLRRRLEGRLEPFETKEIVDLDRTVGQSRGRSSEKSAPKK